MYHVPREDESISMVIELEECSVCSNTLTHIECSRVTSGKVLEAYTCADCGNGKGEVYREV